ncbi:serine/threonine protein kinase [Paenibacillus sp. J31TS4]|uniref:Stk1 family PASTA domain-containing Ser/Thr kinase n=1 Tax=Paenibacillus sp. J31TS4 TaxID=2807195 RepID=UPI001B00A680|nr:Stk1 family PASTA domain-containing Ser/Thr kinase [Paenibacillus sp. J31TS4]GIP36738.1 serine/threonine protein kinase [Paenibacillus sp. J31TS4]
MIGQVLGGRYELLERVGGGGMAIVYKAHDLLLNRNVAVKVLRQQYVHDDEFIHRFEREAQSAASLSHPNVVSIYDVGQQEDDHYIVMEYVEGMTLNDLIKQKAPLQVEEAVHIAAQICDALEHAHANEIIHRDIKPHNILIGRNGRVKVTDFGIARAGTESSITQTGSVVGSVHYFSPEHAKGIAAGAKSDLYSLGIVLYQMLTGRLPFLGDSPISVALKHLQENVEEPRKVNPLIPQSVENIILKAMRKNPETRYQSAHEMLIDLDTCLLPERLNEPKLIDLEDLDDAEKTRIVPAIRPDRGLVLEEQPVATPPEKKSSKWVKPTVWLLVFLVLAAGLWGGIEYVKGNLIIKDVTLPNTVNKTVEDAQKELEAAHLKSEVIVKPNKDVPKDVVYEQSPPAEVKTVKEGSTIKLFVSGGVEQQTMENYVGKKWLDVNADIYALGVDKSRVLVEEKFGDGEPGTIVDQSPKPNEQYDPTTIQLKFTVSKGKEKTKMPGLIGETVEKAEALLADANLKRAPGKDGLIEKPTFAQPKGVIFDQWPYKKGQEVDAGASNIVLYVSAGPPPDAGQMVVSLTDLKPAKEGGTSSYKINVTDAQYDNYELRSFTVSKPETMNLPVVVTKEKNAVIQIFRDGILADTRTVTYDDYLKQKDKPASGNPSPTPTPSPGGTQPPANSGKPQGVAPSRPPGTGGQ